MADQAPIYDLMLLLTEGGAEKQREKILSGVESAIGKAGGSVERNDNWGRRPMAYEIRHQPEAEYHLLQFRAPAPAIEDLSHTLRITDGVLRFRIIKVRPGTPEVKSSPPPVVSAVASSSGGYSAQSSEAASSEPAAESVAEPAAEPVAEPAAEPEVVAEQAADGSNGEAGPDAEGASAAAEGASAEGAEGAAGDGAAAEDAAAEPGAAE